MKISTIAIPLMILSSTIEKVSSAKTSDKGARGLIARGTTKIIGCEKFHVDLILNLLPGENIQGNLLLNCDGGDVCKVKIDCISTEDPIGADMFITSGTAINDCPTANKGETIYAAFQTKIVHDDTQFGVAFGKEGCKDVNLNGIVFLELDGLLYSRKFNP
ncbi:hypothetical protein ACHAW5_008150 [Stephanodiscus triporus]|uniref:Uncharacterized protein n=1 Tax=Stephanodiscus triporus TaxID=2934178 RepID=A0ABD3NAZ8_9STRA